jgi:uncharacterized protein
MPTIRNLEELKASGRIAMECVAGSRMYGTSLPESDEDIKGLYILPSRSFDCLDMLYPQEEIANESQDVKYYELRKFMSLMVKSNPNLLELLAVPKGCMKINTEAFKWLVDRKSLFLSKLAASSYIGYAKDQVNKAQGQNRMVVNPAPVDPPKKEDFCHVFAINWDVVGCDDDSLKRFPMRPIHISRLSILDSRKLSDPLNVHSDYEKRFGKAFHSPFDLSRFHVSSVEHLPNAYRLYAYTDRDDCRGVFRGDGMLACESIPVEDEKRCVGVLTYNVDGFNKAHKDWRRYWEWKRKRNAKRWTDRDGKECRYNSKNMGHCIRLLHAGIHLLKTGEVMVRLDGKIREQVMAVRNGDFAYENIMKQADELTANIKEAEANSPLPAEPDYAKADDMLRELRSEVDGRPDFWLAPIAL